MADELCLPLIAGAALLWYLVCALRQLRTERSERPTFVWREASASGWSEWVELEDVSPTADYADVLSAVRDEAHPGTTAVQFALVVAPVDAPDYTLRVIFMSEVRESSHDLTATGC
ncbi:MAG: hypothetical protein ABW137_04705 [Mycobacterium sp.]